VTARHLAAPIALLLAVVPASSADAQPAPGCPPPPPIEESVRTAPVVFVGTISSLRDEGREATVDVVRVWRGGPLPPKVQVRGTVATQSKVHTALDRIYAQGATYLFLPTAGTRPSFIENQCSSTSVLSSELAALQPSGGGDLPSGISDSTATGGGAGYDRWLPLAIGGVAFVGLGTLLLMARRRARPGSLDRP
jgi:hypothetical protein